MFTRKRVTMRAIAAVLTLAMVLSIVPIAGAQEGIQPETVEQIQPVEQVEQVQPADQFQQAALETAAKEYGLPVETLTVGHSTTAEFPLTGQVAYQYKLIDSVSGETYAVALDPSGQPVKFEQLEAAELAAYDAKYGKLDAALADYLTGQAPEAAVEVMIWLKEGETASPARPSVDAELTEAQAERFAQQADEARAATVAPIVQPVTDRLTSMGITATGSAYSPLVVATLPAGAVQEVSKWSEVDRVYLAPVLTTQMDRAIGTTTKAYDVHNRRVTGYHIKLGVIEVGGRINTANPYLRDLVQDTTNSCLAAHATAVSGIIRSLERTRYFGIAPGASLWIGGSCAGNGGQITNRTDAAANWGAQVFNLSLGGDSGRVVDAFARFYDDLVINRFRTVVVAAGNYGGAGCAQGTNGNVATPGVAYNIITVGNFNDRGAVFSMNACSSWKDPISTSNDREKPEVAAPGTSFTGLTNAAPWTGGIGSGTSYSSPIVAGQAALVLDRNPGLKQWPEAVKAIIMASAAYNIEGGTIWSEKDGAGGVNALRSDDVTRGAAGNFGARTYDCAVPADLDVSTVALQAGKRYRFVIAWDNNPAWANYANRPSADLDLKIVNAGNSTVAQSLSNDNTYEVVEYTPNANGNFRIRVNKWRCDLTPKYLGWAWHRMN